ncbi:uncharacterized protein NEMAJ01_1092 [Nematocida major]|uniref:uncharacterized protein n=1 Tax=Nematocida major TaxID=1912982 RepID=UPI0020087F1C|nr:uncharacterized protein NEMAJ01_1092 [Nematocida major]KAH9386196.1 hypothetical protein NEMAJ01_1092 [Nematocida major]
MSELLEFLNKAKTTNETISGLFECVSVADALRSKTRQTDERQQLQISEAMENLCKDFKSRTFVIKKDLDKMKAENEGHLDRYGFDRGFSTRNNFLQNLARRLTLVMQDFGRVQSGFASIQKERLREQYLIANPHATETELKSLEEKEKGKVLLQSAFTLGNKTVKEALLLAEKRRTSIEALLDGISDLKDLADDFSGIVRDNSCAMDRVHLGVNAANVQAKTAHVIIKNSSKRTIQMQKAKKSLTLFCTFALFVFVLFMVCKLTH